MALQTEIWINDIVEGLFADNSFASRSTDHSGYVNNLSVHVPNAGAPPNVTKNLSTFPATVTSRTDIDLKYDIDQYYTDPIRVSNAEDVELSYNKRQSILLGTKQALQNVVHGDLIYRWLPDGVGKQATSGANTPAYIASATGNRNALVKADILELRKKFDLWNIPQEGRVILLDAVMHAQLLDSLTETESAAFLASANAQTGTVGKIYGFDVIMRSSVAKATAAGVSKLWSATAAATDTAAAIAWHPSTVSRALGAVNLYEEPSSPTYYGYILSALVRAGGSHIRSDKKGIVLLYQGTPA
jgi:hypothetical protein